MGKLEELSGSETPSESREERETHAALRAEEDALRPHTTPDPTPAHLSAARLAEIRERVAAGKFEHTMSDRAALLAHLAALTPPAAPDGEALGRIVWDKLRDDAIARGLDPEIIGSWDTMGRGRRETCRAIAIALHAIGHAAGRSEGEAAAIHADFAGGLSVCSQPGETTKDVARITCPACLVKLCSVASDDADRMRQEVERLVAARAGERASAAEAIDGQAAEIARLTAELAEARAEIEAFQRGSGCVDGYTIGEALAKIGASLNRTPTEGIPDAIERLKKEKAAARRDGAREERRLTIVDTLTVARETHPSAQPAVCEAMRELGKLVNARGEGQGS